MLDNTHIVNTFKGILHIRGSLFFQLLVLSISKNNRVGRMLIYQTLGIPLLYLFGVRLSLGHGFTWRPTRRVIPKPIINMVQIAFLLSTEAIR